MTDKFSCTWHAGRRVIECTLTGMWAAPDVTAYYEAMRDLVAAHALDGPVAILTDLSDYPVQMPEVADVHQAMLPRIGANPAISRVAWLVGGVVAAMQAKRSAQDTTEVAIFADRAEAWAYVSAQPVA